MIAAPNSGSGKTVISLALLRALKISGHDVRAAKAGPDYIDPAFHEVSSGISSINLDPWAMSSGRCRDLAGTQAGDGGTLLIESMMGLFDGAIDGSGTSASLARALDVPVVLVVDAAKQSHSIAALVGGFRDHDRDINICGVILNRLGSARHEAMLRQALSEIGMPVLGAVMRNSNLELPERHLGLVQAGEMLAIEAFISGAAKQIAKECDLEFLIDCFRPLQLTNAVNENSTEGIISPPGQNIAIARDQAFSFIYPHLLNDWRGQGAQISFFSPLADEGPADDADAVYLPGGYPELHAGRISNAENFSSLMEKARSRNSLIYGECGGYMVLGNGLVDGEGTGHSMLGFLQLGTSFEIRQLHLGYRVLAAHGDFFAGKSINAHEFHYTCAISETGDPLFSVCDALGSSLGDHGLRDGNVMGSYMHLISAREHQDG